MVARRQLSRAQLLCLPLPSAATPLHLPPHHLLCLPVLALAILSLVRPSSFGQPTGLFRATRAWQAGLLAGAVLRGERAVVDPTPVLATRSRVYIVVRCRATLQSFSSQLSGDSRPTWEPWSTVTPCVTDSRLRVSAACTPRPPVYIPLTRHNGDDSRVSSSSRRRWSFGPRVRVAHRASKALRVCGCAHQRRRCFAAVPVGALDFAQLNALLVGPSTELTVPLSEEDEEGALVPNGESAGVMVVDFAEEVSLHLSRYDPVTSPVEVMPFVEGLPHQLLVHSEAREWVVNLTGNDGQRRQQVRLRKGEWPPRQNGPLPPSWPRVWVPCCFDPAGGGDSSQTEGIGGEASFCAAGPQGGSEPPHAFLNRAFVKRASRGFGFPSRSSRRTSEDSGVAPSPPDEPRDRFCSARTPAPWAPWWPILCLNQKLPHCTGFRRAWVAMVKQAGKAPGAVGTPVGEFYVAGQPASPSSPCSGGAFSCHTCRRGGDLF